MKKIITAASVLLLSISVNAQTAFIDYVEKSEEDQVFIYVTEAGKEMKVIEVDGVVKGKQMLVAEINAFAKRRMVVNTTSVTSHDYRKSHHYHYHYVIQRNGIEIDQPPMPMEREEVLPPHAEMGGNQGAPQGPEHEMHMSNPGSMPAPPAGGSMSGGGQASGGSQPTPPPPPPAPEEPEQKPKDSESFENRGGKLNPNGPGGKTPDGPQ